MTIVSLMFILGIVILLLWLFQARRVRHHETIRFMHVSGKWRKKLLAMYAAVLLIATGAAIIFPPYEASESYIIEDEFKFYEDMYAKIHAGKIADVEGLSLVKRWNYPFEQSQLLMKVDYSGFNGLMLFTKAKDNEEQASTIEVDYYQTKTYLGSKDVTERMSKPRINLKGDTLIILPPPPVNITGTSFEQESITKQFNGVKMDNGIYGQGIMIGREVIIVHVPKNIEVISGDESLQWIND